MIELNKVLLVARLTADPEVSRSKSDTAIAKVRMAVNRRGWGDREEETSFFDATAFGQTAEFISKYFQKGKAIFIEGRLKQDRWDDRETGKPRSKVEIIIERAAFAETKAEQEGRSGGASSGGGGGYSRSRDEQGSGGDRDSGGRSGGNRPEPAFDGGGQTDDDLPF